MIYDVKFISQMLRIYCRNRAITKIDAVRMRKNAHIFRNVSIKILSAFLILNIFLFVFPVDNALAATQYSYRWRNDDGNESTATWPEKVGENHEKVGENEALTGLKRGETKRLRFGIKADKNDNELVRVAKLSLTPSVGHNIHSSVIDTAAGYAYFGTATSPGKILKVRLSDFKLVASITAPEGANDLNSSVIDTKNGYAYFGAEAGPSKISSP